MNPTQLERLREQLTRLRLLKSRERLDALLQEAAAKDLSYADFLDQVLGEEVAAKAEKNITMRTSLARFPFVKSLDAFDFSYQPSLDKKQIQQVATCHFIEHGENLVILGPPGVGKSHLAHRVGAQGHRTGLSRVVHHRRHHDRHTHPGADGESAGGQAEALYDSTPADH
jgi:DNA replication protein DnaC